MLVVVAIPTYKRPLSLARTLNSLCCNDSDYNVIVLVADNDSIMCEGIDVCKEFNENGFSLQLNSILVKEQGLTHVRNALLSEAFDVLHADYLAFIDDDEIAAPNWLNELFNAAESSGADIVGGKILAKFDKEMPSWIESLEIYYQQHNLQNGFVHTIQASGNCMISKRIFQFLPSACFDEYFNFSGGEDRDFFLRLAKANCKFYVNLKAVTYECFPNERVDKSWALSRSQNIGANEFRVQMRHGLKLSKLAILLAKAIIAYLYYGLLSNLVLLNSDKRFKYLLKVQRQVGKFKTLFSKESSFYKYN